MDYGRSPSSVSGAMGYQGLGKPDSKAKFRPGQVKEIIREVISKLGDVQYNHETSAVLVKQLSTEIRDRTRQLNFPRYKILVHVVLGALKGQGVRVANRCFWDAETDEYASESFRNVSSSTYLSVSSGQPVLRGHSLRGVRLLIYCNLRSEIACH